MSTLTLTQLLNYGATVIQTFCFILVLISLSPRRGGGIGGLGGGECEGGGGRVRMGRGGGRDSVGTTMLKPKAADRSSIISTC